MIYNTRNWSKIQHKAKKRKRPVLMPEKKKDKKTCFQYSQSKITRLK